MNNEKWIEKNTWEDSSEYDNFDVDINIGMNDVIITKDKLKDLLNKSILDTDILNQVILDYLNNKIILDVSNPRYPDVIFEDDVSQKIISRYSYAMEKIGDSSDG